MDDLYVDTIIDRYKHPTNKGWKESAPNGIQRTTMKTHNPSCGDSFEIEILTDGGTIVSAQWQGEGCAISTVSTDSLCEWLIGKKDTQRATLSKDLIRDLTGIETITQAREKCLYLPLHLSND